MAFILSDGRLQGRVEVAQQEPRQAAWGEGSPKAGVHHRVQGPQGARQWRRRPLCTAVQRIDTVCDSPSALLDKVIVRSGNRQEGRVVSGCSMVDVTAKPKRTFQAS